jgi:hypothetical protein
MGLLRSTSALFVVILVPAAIGCGDIPFSPNPPGRQANVVDASPADVVIEDGADAACGLPPRPATFPTPQACQDCVTEKCLEIALECVSDEPCLRCGSDNVAPGCDQQSAPPAYRKIVECGCERCPVGCAQTCIYFKNEEPKCD